MATKETTLAVYKAIKNNLGRRFKTLQEQKGSPYDFNLAENSYFKYIGENIITARITRELMLEGRLHKPAIKELFSSFISIRKTAAGPVIWDEKLEDKYGFEEERKEIMTSARKEYAASLLKKKKAKVLDKRFISDEIGTDIDELINEKYALKMLPIIRQLQDNLMESLDEEMILIESDSSNKDGNKDKTYPKSIYLVTKSIVLDSVIFLVIDEQFKMPVRFSTVNNNGTATCITKLHNIAYLVDVPGKKVKYNKQLASDINNGILRRGKIADYLKSNKLSKPTLVKKSENGKILVLNNDTLVENISIHGVPAQFRHLYIDKTN